jgi:pseudouridine synthase
MQERLQKIIARAGIASRRHSEQLIRSGQVRVNGEVVTELGTKADPTRDRIEAAGRTVAAEERRVYLVMHKPPEIVSAMADPEGRRTLKNLLRGFPERVYPVGNLDYAASGLVFLTNDGDLAAELLRNWGSLEEVYYIKIKGRLTREELDQLGKKAGVHLNTVRQPDATRGRSANFWYEARIRNSRKERLRDVLFKANHPAEKWKRVALGPLTLEGIPQGRYRLLEGRDVNALRRAEQVARSRKASAHAANQSEAGHSR